MADQVVTLSSGTEFNVQLESAAQKTVDMAVQPKVVTLETSINLGSPPSGPNPFTALSDTPASYAGKAGWVVAVNVTENGVTFIPVAGGGAVTWGSITGLLADQTDLQEALDAKADQTDLDTVAATANSAVQPADLTKTAVGLSNVDNTADADKPVSIAQQAALDLKAPLSSPNFTGNPTVPTQTAGNNSTRAASTAFVTAAVAALLDSAPATLDTLNELAAALGDDPNFATTLASSLGLKANTADVTAALAGKLDTTVFSGFTSIAVVSELPDPQVTGVLYILTT